ncbi:MAG: magnesium transporter [Helicobacteraceae bacterium]|nr:magnesium transporter [Helicobacteraceae bacterium]
MKQNYSQLNHSFEEYLQNPTENRLHPSEIAYLLKKTRKKNKEQFLETLDQIPEDILGDVLLELPEKIKDEAIEFLPSHELSRAMESLESDDATDLLLDIEDADESKAEIVISQLDVEDAKEIESLRHYEDNQAGSIMQVELFNATLDEKVQDSIDRLKQLKSENELENIHQVFIINEERRLIAAIPLEDVILFDFTKTFDEQLLVKEFRSVEASTDVEEVANMFEQYDLNVIPVVDWQGKLIGRITSDDIYDVIEELATDQIYHLAGVDDDVEQEDKVVTVAINRAIWLGINLVTALMASLVIAQFSHVLQAFIPLAILMPIVASMGGNAGLQALTVMVRRIALGEVELENAKDAIKRESGIALFNGASFAIIMGAIAYFWFGVAMLGVVIALAMVTNIFIAGIIGAGVPLILKRLEIDPAVGSSVMLTMSTDIIGFFVFLSLANWLIV